MGKKSSSAQSGGIGFCGLLTIVFITLKLLAITEVAMWSWWWVFAPLWIPVAVVIFILFVVYIYS